ncbi:hypothetical protein ACH5RR_029288 [Cinchona calisaya]|uniref:Uncharacterized protein n=1 Tax=Cinchona calisaya TaxID=153742 RepID=A0ABD2YUI7_9GENT
MPRDKKDELLHRRREYYVEKKMEKEAGVKSPPLKTRVFRIKTLIGRKRHKTTLKKLTRLEKVTKKPLELPTLPNYQHCDAERFYLEPPNFRCARGEVSYVIQAMPDWASGIQLYFHDTKEELSRRHDAPPKLRESTVKLLMSILGQNPYAKFFKGFTGHSKS